jgi:UDP-2,3-diacylglucosamine pyrophosphatase LpxH
MVKLFLSDLHLGNILFEKKKDLINLLSSSKYDSIYLLGDILDTWSMELEHILIIYGDVIYAINKLGVKCTIIKGNHDPDLETMQKVFDKIRVIEGNYSFILGGERTILMHGNEFDDSGAFMMFLLKCISPIQWIFTKAGMSFSYRLRDWYYEKKHGSNFYNKLALGNEKKTVKKYSVDNKIIIMGHTHVGKIVETPEYKYINCGTALHDASAVEFDGMGFRLVRY